MAYTIDKHVFLRNFSIHYTYYKLRSFNGIALHVMTTCTLFSDSGLTHMQILLNFIRL